MEGTTSRDDDHSIERQTGTSQLINGVVQDFTNPDSIAYIVMSCIARKAIFWFRFRCHELHCEKGELLISLAMPWAALRGGRASCFTCDAMSYITRRRASCFAGDAMSCMARRSSFISLRLPRAALREGLWRSKCHRLRCHGLHCERGEKDRTDGGMLQVGCQHRRGGIGVPASPWMHRGADIRVHASLRMHWTWCGVLHGFLRRRLALELSRFGDVLLKFFIKVGARPPPYGECIVRPGGKHSAPPREDRDAHAAESIVRRSV